MPLLASGLVLGVIAGLVARGDPRRLGDIRLRGLPLIALAVAVRLAVPLAPLPLFAASLLLVFAVAAWNRTLPGAWLIALGALSNAVVVAANGAMPVDLAADLQAGRPGAFDGAHTLLGPQTRLPFLADIFPITRGVYSVGDLVSAAGGFWIVFRTMKP